MNLVNIKTSSIELKIVAMPNAFMPIILYPNIVDIAKKSKVQMCKLSKNL